MWLVLPRRRTFVSFMSEVMSKCMVNFHNAILNAAHHMTGHQAREDEHLYDAA